MARSPTGHLVVALRSVFGWDVLDWLDQSELTGVIQTSGASDLIGLLPDLLQLPSRRIVSNPRAMLRREGWTEAHGGPFPDRTMTRYWTLDVSQLTAFEEQALLSTLRAAGQVERAYRHPRIVPASVDSPETNDHFEKQVYLASAPDGIDAISCWRRQLDGSGVRFADLEGKWQFDHPDLITNLVSEQEALIIGDLGHGRVHGTNAVGVVLAENNDIGVVGIAPLLERASVISCFREATDTEPEKDWLVAEALTELLADEHSDRMSAGDILLLEMHVQIIQEVKILNETEKVFRYLPLEVVPHIRDAIASVTAADIIVIEPAGNGSTMPYGTGNEMVCGNDLDKLADYSWVDDFETGQAEALKPGEDLDLTLLEDSGAILVGASFSELDALGVGHAAANFPADDITNWGTNYGKRVDCYAWGENVWTTHPTRPDEPDYDPYTGAFHGTSSASAIIAGAAILTQQMSRKLNGKTLTPAEMRDLFRNAALGTPGDEKYPIGVMPDLNRIYLHLVCPGKSGILLLFCLLYAWVRQQFAVLKIWKRATPALPFDPVPLPESVPPAPD